MQSFDQLVVSINSVHDSLRQSVAQTANRMLTMRNWLIGMYIVEYEQKGEDRAAYGQNLISSLSKKLRSDFRRGFSERNLLLFREFYRTYPEINEIVIAELPRIRGAGSLLFPIPQLPTAELENPIIQEPTEQLATGLYHDKNQILTSIFSRQSPAILMRHFSFTHFVELMRIADPLKRAFYEIEGINGCWSVPQLKRQMESQLYERTGLSKDKTGLVAQAHKQNIPATIDDLIRDPYILEFTGLPEHHQYSENDLETALLDHIQAFMLELGNGFCFEARQKRITLDNEHDRIDLVFYHRILRCHVLIDLKIRKFRHGDAGQMNFYLNYYKDQVMAQGDNPPVGLILCTDRAETRVKYATAGMDNNLFVSQYLTALPSEEQIVRFLQSDRDRTENVLREQAGFYGGVD